MSHLFISYLMQTTAEWPMTVCYFGTCLVGLQSDYDSTTALSPLQLGFDSLLRSPCQLRLIFRRHSKREWHWIWFENSDSLGKFHSKDRRWKAGLRPQLLPGEMWREKAGCQVCVTKLLWILSWSSVHTFLGSESERLFLNHSSDYFLRKHSSWHTNWHRVELDFEELLDEELLARCSALFVSSRNDYIDSPESLTLTLRDSFQANSDGNLFRHSINVVVSLRSPEWNTSRAGGWWRRSRRCPASSSTPPTSWTAWREKTARATGSTTASASRLSTTQTPSTM